MLRVLQELDCAADQQKKAACFLLLAEVSAQIIMVGGLGIIKAGNSGQQFTIGGATCSILTNTNLW